MVGGPLRAKGLKGRDMQARFVFASFMSHPKNSNNINCCLNGISRIYFKSLEKKI